MPCNADSLGYGPDSQDKKFESIATMMKGRKHSSQHYLSGIFTTLILRELLIFPSIDVLVFVKPYFVNFIY